MDSLKGLILSGGKGTRLRPITHTSAKPFLGQDPFVMYLGDNLLQGGIADLVHAFREHRPDALILLTPVPDPENYGVAELAEAPAGQTGHVVRLVEKPAHPTT